MHDLITAFRYADTGLLLKEGWVRFYSPVQEIQTSLIEEVNGIGVELHAINGRKFVIPVH